MTRMGHKLFTLEESRKLLPGLRNDLRRANDELEELLESMRIASDRYDQAERRLADVKACTSTVANLSELRVLRSQFQESIEALSRCQNHYVKRLNEWVEKITSRGVILRDLREGLLDFPACENGFEYHLCWRMDEDDINFWHGNGDGFIGRKPLTALCEYI